jgi:O-antigen ligase
MTFSFVAVLTPSRIQVITTVFCAFIITGLFTSSFFRILPSIGIIGLTLIAILYAVTYSRVEQGPNWSGYLSLTIVFLLHLLSGLYTQTANSNEYWRDILLQSPFLLLPLAFWLLPPLKAKYLRRLWFLFFALVVIFALGSTINYLLDAKHINETYLHSQVMPTEPDHIRFSLMISLAIAVGATMLVHKTVPLYWNVWVIACTTFLVFYQHLLAVRSGLLTFYSLGIVAVVWLIFKAAKYRLAARLICVLILLPILSFICFPTFQNKFHNTKEDMGQIDQMHSANNYSLTGRVYSYKVAMMLVYENPWLGVSNADMQQELAKKYKVAFPSIRPSSYIKPHNQFIYCLVAFGFVGAILFAACFYYPVIWAWPRHAPLLTAHYLIITLSFLVEYTLETQVGLTFSLIFLLMALSGLVNREATNDEWTPA